MSTDPREFENPIDGSGDVTPEAIETAARALLAITPAENLPYVTVPCWSDLHEADRIYYRRLATAALTAAAPFIAAQALRDAVSDFESNVGVAEFDEQNRRDGCRHTYSDEAWEHQSAYMGWLLNRADQVEGKSE